MAKITVWGDFKVNAVERLRISDSLRQLLGESDANVVNCEAPIRGVGSPVRKSGPNISQSAESLGWIEEHGFNVVSLANNHTMDYGPDGMEHTRKAFTKAAVIGAGTWEEAYAPAVITTKDGLRVGVLACTHCEFGTLTDEYRRQEKGTAWACSPEFDRAVQWSGGGKNLDFLIVFAHCGVEYMEQPLPEWRMRYRRWIELGADAVIASHPHVPQGWEMYQGKPICYSLGNFCFERLGKKPMPVNWYNSLVCVLDIGKDGLKGMEMRPIVYNPEGLIMDSHEDRFARYMDRINQTLMSEEAYLSYVNEYVERLLPFYMNQFSRGGLVSNPFSIGFMKGLAEGVLGRGMLKREHWLNNIQCESHRWALLRAMNLRKK